METFGGVGGGGGVGYSFIQPSWELLWVSLGLSGPLHFIKDPFECPEGRILAALIKPQAGTPPAYKNA